MESVYLGFSSCVLVAIWRPAAIAGPGAGELVADRSLGAQPEGVGKDPQSLGGTRPAWLP